MEFDRQNAHALQHTQHPFQNGYGITNCYNDNSHTIHSEISVCDVNIESTVELIIIFRENK